MRILVVDDSPTMLSMASKTLAGMGFSDTVLCDSAESAIRKLDAERLDLILLDWHMPGYSGLDFLRIIKNQEKTKNIPVIMLTVEEHPRSVQEAFDSGADGYLIKPVAAEKLRQALTQLGEKGRLG